MVSHQGMVKQQ